ncbi:hypothetical protein BDP81DRAFT_155701 [Colletotrichum phormii]|uniref:Uncharacterized protein n=1 Tax=Colletotrichum phormii TaxID=359342 RepID=A0AAI9ZCY8_9PEZI|nr:uncharacterized protein BDP81DRAFT_155701 [Colletotrichum phormii]KAK1622220.1 hypothetical protein BDP81DRAFT_155701 [Colletotrichum phormii]
MHLFGILFQLQSAPNAKDLAQDFPSMFLLLFCAQRCFEKWLELRRNVGKIGRLEDFCPCCLCFVEGLRLIMEPVECYLQLVADVFPSRLLQPDLKGRWSVIRLVHRHSRRLIPKFFLVEVWSVGQAYYNHIAHTGVFVAALHTNQSSQAWVTGLSD